MALQKSKGKRWGRCHTPSSLPTPAVFLPGKGMCWKGPKLFNRRFPPQARTTQFPSPCPSSSTLHLPFHLPTHAPLSTWLQGEEMGRSCTPSQARRAARRQPFSGQELIHLVSHPFSSTCNRYCTPASIQLVNINALYFLKDVFQRNVLTGPELERTESPWL